MYIEAVYGMARGKLRWKEGVKSVLLVEADMFTGFWKENRSSGRRRLGREENVRKVILCELLLTRGLDESLRSPGVYRCLQ